MYKHIVSPFTSIQLYGLGVFDAARDTIERLINFLDDTGPDPDLEDDGAELEDDDPAEFDDTGIGDSDGLLEQAFLGTGALSAPLNVGIRRDVATSRPVSQSGKRPRQ